MLSAEALNTREPLLLGRRSGRTEPDQETPSIEAEIVHRGKGTQPICLTFLWTSHMYSWHTHVATPQEGDLLAQSKHDLLQGTLDLMMLRTLSALRPLHGYGIARRIEQAS